VATSAVPPPPPGWTVKQRRGETVYCQSESVTGSRYPKETCVKPAPAPEPTSESPAEATG
jgi:hypothetical protein